MASAKKRKVTRKVTKKPAAKAPRKVLPKKRPAKRPAKAGRPVPKRRAAAHPRAPRLPMPEELLTATGAADVVAVPARTVAAIEGAGGPHGDEFGRSVGALYGVAYTLKFSRKPAGGDFQIGPLEGRWWADGAASRAAPPPIDQWRWRLRIGVPDDVDEHALADVIQAATMKKGGKLFGSAEARRVAIERVPAQTMGRILHLGPYADEPRSFAKIEEALAAARRTPAFPHLEIYLSDPRRTKPAKLKTVLLLETV